MLKDEYSCPNCGTGYKWDEIPEKCYACGEIINEENIKKVNTNKNSLNESKITKHDFISAPKKIEKNFLSKEQKDSYHRTYNKAWKDYNLGKYEEALDYFSQVPENLWKTRKMKSKCYEKIDKKENEERHFIESDEQYKKICSNCGTERPLNEKQDKCPACGSEKYIIKEDVEKNKSRDMHTSEIISKPFTQETNSKKTTNGNRAFENLYSEALRNYKENTVEGYSEAKKKFGRIINFKDSKKYLETINENEKILNNAKELEKKGRRIFAYFEFRKLKKGWLEKELKDSIDECKSAFTEVIFKFIFFVERFLIMIFFIFSCDQSSELYFSDHLESFFKSLKIFSFFFALNVKISDDIVGAIILYCLLVFFFWIIMSVLYKTEYNSGWFYFFMFLEFMFFIFSYYAIYKTCSIDFCGNLIERLYWWFFKR